MEFSLIEKEYTTAELKNIRYPCSDGNQLNPLEIFEITNRYKTPQKYIHKNIEYLILCSQMNIMCGYVNIQEELPYEGHGGITGSYDLFQGFDCAHLHDILIMYNYVPVQFNDTSTVKLPSFVHKECHKIIDSYLKNNVNNYDCE
jgi:hypothetical protein